MAATFPSQITEYDPIDIPTEPARARDPIHVIQRDHPAWPGAEIVILLDYNNSQSQWNIKVELGDHGTIVERQPAEYSRVYSFRQYVAFIFSDLAGEVENVTPATLGGEVELYAIPGPDSPGYDAWRERQMTDETGA